MDRLACMEVFVCVVEKGSLSAAADACRISPTMVGKHLRYLEERLGARLLNRTTRRQSLTEIGRTFYERSKAALAQVEAAEACAGEMQQVPRGVLHVNAPVSFGANALVKGLSEYLARYPEVKVELSLNDRVVDLVEEGIEAAIRIGSLPDSSMVARPLAPYRMVVCAAPHYLARCGTPATPEQLAGHNCMGFKYSASQKHWTFIGEDGSDEVAVSGNLCVNNGQALKTAALCGMGVIMQPEVLLSEDLDQGRLVRLLPGHALPAQPMHILYPSSRNMTPKLKSFVDFVVERFGAV
ncbi:LysR family transcriptional regulator [Noviherbaspirillum denitrificans]|uniref:LysR family transcriptional regulator n=1 Tax=Noviherbaspirillum denitrificans TaxID=1968433 RepID=A0A254TEG9_9BURK|nr:LysR family transcriptional regulator [Noviherbaspirillum denitrificans]OWW21030.1 LysR family transcriptional regulator [Noviherbaspirillum denitrificans]